MNRVLLVAIAVLAVSPFVNAQCQSTLPGTAHCTCGSNPSVRQLTDSGCGGCYEAVLKPCPCDPNEFYGDSQLSTEQVCQVRNRELQDCFCTQGEPIGIIRDDSKIGLHAVHVYAVTCDGDIRPLPNSLAYGE